ncbi:L,D-transpeptidase [Actinoalloteichus hymeniacidonis]|uniref:L,D-transpeptidase n=1 Tax=Actinoalloteichus hymeniacidonis TaxID=340345 RepID=UPI0017F9E82A|nr:Ig-like domain-containing protein [Actinoalloteichus hymeniacidonis]MBB5909775.1 lipoprotein-anchoring transpeptidase ErfK/SrfK [Actinoalloteichus hymeniacidonis]
MSRSARSIDQGRPGAARRRTLAAAVGLVTLLLASCTSAGGSESGGGAGGGAGQGGETSAPPAPEVSLSLPADAETDVAPGDPVLVEAADGVLTEVVMTNPEGEPVAGEIAEDGASWTTTEPLGYGREYSLTATGENADGEEITETSSFTTANPRYQTFVGFSPLPDETIGVGHPLAFYFDSGEPIQDKAAAEEAISITTEPEVEGAFYWFDDTRVHWRPKEYWEPGTVITIDADIYGKHLGNGVYGSESRQSTLTVGDSFVAYADGQSHELKVEINGELVRTMPTSLGKAPFQSWDGVHVVTEKHAQYTMDSSTYGLDVASGGYVTDVQWATRIANNGEFVHAAPWNPVLGQANDSHGCINLSMEDAKWFFDNVKRGDVVIIENSGGQELPGDGGVGGFNDWQIPWEEWSEGGHR